MKNNLYVQVKRPSGSLYESRLDASLLILARKDSRSAYVFNAHRRELYRVTLFRRFSRPSILGP